MKGYIPDNPRKGMIYDTKKDCVIVPLKLYTDSPFYKGKYIIATPEEIADYKKFVTILKQKIRLKICDVVEKLDFKH